MGDNDTDVGSAGVNTDVDESKCGGRKSGAVGSRLTGAGWGGCTVSMVPEDKLEEFLLRVQERYYKTDERKSRLLQQSLFATKPGPGARVLLEEK